MCKFETFVFDAIPRAQVAVLLEVEREEEFAPVKSRTGEDTPANARRMMTRKAARWLEAAGVPVPRDAAGDPIHPLELSPLTAMYPEDLVGLHAKGRKVEGPLAL